MRFLSMMTFYSKKSKTLYSGHLLIADSFLRNCRCLRGLTVYPNFQIFAIIFVSRFWFFTEIKKLHMFFQGSPVVDPPDVLVISFPDFTPRIGNPEVFKGFAAPTTAAPH